MKQRTKYGSLAMVLALLGGTAHAQPAGAQAETLFRQGKDLMAKGKIAEACAAFDASQKLDPTVSTLLNQAACREKNNQFATAWGLFLEAERQTRTATDPQSQQRHQVAASKAAKLEPRLSTLTITVGADNRVGGLQILRSGEPVDPGAWNKALPIDGGTYKITASAPGNAEWSSTITVADERDAKAIEIPKLKAAALEPAHVASAPSAGSEPAAATASHKSLLLPLVFGGATVALAGVALGFELSASSTYDKAKAEPDNDKQNSLWHSANTRRYVAEAMGVAAVGCAGVAIWLYLRPGHEESAVQTAGVHVAPVFTASTAGIAMSGTY